MKKILFLLTILLSLFSASMEAKNETEIETESVDNSIIIDRIGNDDVVVSIPSPLFSFTEADIKIKFINPSHTRLLLNKNRVEFIINGEPTILDFVNGESTFKHNFKDSNNLSIYTEDFSFNKNVRVYPLWAIVIPIVLIVLFILIYLFKPKN
jgi:hypothetical protein